MVIIQVFVRTYQLNPDAGCGTLSRASCDSSMADLFVVFFPVILAVKDSFPCQSIGIVFGVLAYRMLTLVGEPSY